jgi:hypothetical protein
VAIVYELPETLRLVKAIEASCRPKTASFLMELLSEAIRAERDHLRPPATIPSVSAWFDDLSYTDISSIATTSVSTSTPTDTYHLSGYGGTPNGLHTVTAKRIKE